MLSSESDHVVSQPCAFEGDLAAKVKELEKKVEDRTNRQLRKTMIFRNIKETEEEKTWEDTTDIVAGKISSLLDIDLEDAEYMIDRCHRGGDPKFYKRKNRIRPIYIAFLRWPDCEQIIKAARGQNEFHVDYKFGPLTTARRNEALKLRKEMKKDGKLTKAFVRFPAVLMGKKVGSSKYEIIRDFSDDEVVPKKEE